jgi:hypothetical protein
MRGGGREATKHVEGKKSSLFFLWQSGGGDNLILSLLPFEVAREQEVVLHVLVGHDVPRHRIGEVQPAVLLGVVRVDEHAAQHAREAAVPGVPAEVDAVADAAPFQDHGHRRHHARGHVVILLLHRQPQQLPLLLVVVGRRLARRQRGQPLRVVVLLEARAGAAAGAHGGRRRGLS